MASSQPAPKESSVECSVHFPRAPEVIGGFIFLAVEVELKPKKVV